MAFVTMMSTKENLESAVKKKVFDFLAKLQVDDTAPGLHIEPLRNVADDRVRTGRVDQFYRAVLFKLGATAGHTHYIYVGTWPHDDAIEAAKTKRLRINPVNGIAELIESDVTIPPVAPRYETAPAAETPATGRTSSDEVEIEVPEAVPLAGLSILQLTGELGIAEDLAAAALAATNDVELMALVDAAVPWQGLALLDLALGATIKEVKEKFAISEYLPDPERSEDERTIEALEHPAARVAFTFIENNEELRQAIEEGTFGSWRVFLHPEQRRYVDRDYSGTFRLSGGAGTGKTVVILHRADRLAEANPSARIVVTTYGKNLADNLRHDLLRLRPSIRLARRLGDRGVFIAGVDSLAHGVATGAPELGEASEEVLGQRIQTVGSTQQNDAWQQAIDTVSPQLPPNVSLPSFFADEYELIILPGRISSKESYFSARRPGRGVALDRVKRAEVWKVVEAFRQQARIAGTLDHSEASAIAAVALEKRRATGGGTLADHVLVDEGQDLVPAKWQFLRALAAPGPNDLFIAEDSHQRIYGPKVTLGRYGIKIVGRSHRLQLNYRTTAENLKLGLAVLSGASYVDMEEQAEAADYRSARSGPAPIMLPCKSRNDEWDRAAQLVSYWREEESDPTAIAVLVNTNKQRDELVSAMRERGVTVKPVSGENVPDGAPLAMTIHRSKGLEFARVLVVGMGSAHFPSKWLVGQTPVEDLDDLMLRHRSLLYVGMTRARDHLAIAYSGDPTELLPTKRS